MFIKAVHVFSFILRWLRLNKSNKILVVFSHLRIGQAAAFEHNAQVKMALSDQIRLLVSFVL